MPDDSEPGGEPAGESGSGKIGGKNGKLATRRIIDRTRRLARIDKASGAGRYQNRIKQEVINDLGGREELTRIQLELIDLFAGAAVTMRYMTAELALGRIANLDFGAYSQVGNMMLRVGSRLGLERERRADLKPDLDTFLALRKHKPASDLELVEPEIEPEEETEFEPEVE